MPDTDLMRLADRIVAVIENGKQQLAIDINHDTNGAFDITVAPLVNHT